jgi:hypothetical protein
MGGALEVIEERVHRRVAGGRVYRQAAQDQGVELASDPRAGGARALGLSGSVKRLEERETERELVAALVGYAIVVWAMASNSFFSQTIRIETERGPTVATGGPYGFVRHPSYVGSILAYLGTPVLLGSWPSILLGAVMVVLMIVRTALEDRTLQAELPGYKE